MQVAGYAIDGAIGRGGFGVVYRGRDARFARDVAIKVLNGALDETMAARFQRECHAVGALSGHPHIVVVHDSGTTEEGLSFLVMELLPGGSLVERLEASGVLGWQVAAELGVQLAGALETAHRSGVLHRDVKPENVLFSAYGQPKLVDFGIATVRGGFETKSASISASLAHAAPEILAGQRATAESDVYALGSTLFQALAGNPAFLKADDETLFPLLARITSAPVPDLRPVGVPDGVAKVLERAMEKRPEDRYATALELGTALRTAAAGDGVPLAFPMVLREGQAAPVAEQAAQTRTPSTTPPAAPVSSPDPAPPDRRRLTPAALTALGLAAAVLVAAGGWALWPSSPAASATVYRFAEAGDGSVTSDRTWTLAGHGTQILNDTILRSRSPRPLIRTALEVIPKSIATDVNQLSFSSNDIAVLVADPVVRWTVRLAPGATAHLRWTVRLPRTTGMDGLKAMAADLRRAESDLRPRLTALAGAAGIPSRELVPFALAAVPDSGLVASPSPSASPTPARAVVTLSPAPRPTTQPTSRRTVQPGSTSAPPPANRPPTLAPIGDVAADELARVSLTPTAADPDGDAVTMAVVGALPAGLAFDGHHITGTLTDRAVSLTQTKTQLAKKSFALTIKTSDSHGLAGQSRTFHLVVRDTALPMPSYVGYYGCRGTSPCSDPSSLPGAAQLGAPDFIACVEDNSKTSGTVAWQGTAPGAVFRWGGAFQLKYYGTTTNHCA